MPNKFLKLMIVVVLLIIFYIGVVLFRGYKFYNSVFRLKEEQVTLSLEKIETNCKKIIDCELLPGDIIIRRYVTERTRDFDEMLDPYFTHSALYLGNGELFEALGTDETPENQVKITKFKETDWVNPDMKNFVIVRQKNHSEKINSIILKLRDIADDPEYTFGPIKEGRKTVSCSDIILKSLMDEKIIISLSNMPPVITPDYLFWATEKEKQNFEIVGFNIN